MKCSTKILNKIETSIERNLAVQVIDSNGFAQKLVAKQVCYIQGKMCVVYVKLESMQLDFSFISSFEKVSFLKECRVDLPENSLKDFYDSHRSQSVREIRLLLEVNSLNAIPVNKYSLFRNIVSYEAVEGRFIWSAYVEISLSLNVWLEKIKESSQVKILGPVCIKTLVHENKAA